MHRLRIARSMLLCTVAGATASAAQTRSVASAATVAPTTTAPVSSVTVGTLPPHPPPGGLGYSAGCPTPSLNMCQDGSYLESACAATHVTEVGTCSVLVEEAMRAREDEAKPSVIAKELNASGVDHVIADPGTPSEPYYTPDPYSVTSMYEAVSYGGDVPAPAQSLYAANGFAVNVYEQWAAGKKDEVRSCEEYVYEKYFDLNIYHRLLGADLNDPMKALSVAFGPLNSPQSIGTRHLASPALRGVDGREFGEFFVKDVVWKNAFFDIPAFVTQTVQHINLQGPNLHQSIANYSDLGEALLGTIEDNRDSTASGKHSWARMQWMWQNLMYHPPAGLGKKTPTPSGSAPDPGSTVTVTPNDPITGGGNVAWNGAGDPATALLGVVPGHEHVRRHLADELNELYGLQMRLREQLRKWRETNLKYKHSGWSPTSLLQPHEGTFQGNGSGGSGGSAGFGSVTVGMHTDPSGPAYSAASSSGGSGGSAPVLPGNVAIDPPDDTEETIVRRRIVKEITSILDEALSRGCLDSGLTPCDWSPMSFARDAHANFAAAQEAAYDTCVEIVEGVAVGSDQPPTDGSLPNLLGRTYTFVPAGNEYACAVYVPETLTAQQLEALPQQVQHCREQQLKQEELEAKEELAASSPLYDDTTGEWLNPGMIKEGGEEMGNKYFGLDYGYKFGWELDMSGGVCGMQAWAGAEFDAGATVFKKHFTMVDFEASLDTADSDDDDKVIDIHGEIFGKSMFDDIVVEQGDIEPLLEWSRTREVSESKEATLIEQRFVIVVVPVRLSAGIAGRIGAELGINAELAGFTDGTCPRIAVGGLVKPFIGIDAFVEAGIDIFVASAGIHGALTLIEAGAPFEPNVSVTLAGGEVQGDDIQPVNLTLDVNTSLKLELSTLSGKLSAFAAAGPCPLCVKGKWTIVEWNGPKWSKTLIDESYSAPLASLDLVY